jgi:hypothetical protein
MVRTRRAAKQAMPPATATRPKGSISGASKGIMTRSATSAATKDKRAKRGKDAAAAEATSPREQRTKTTASPQARGRGGQQRRTSSRRSYSALSPLAVPTRAVAPSPGNAPLVQPGLVRLSPPSAGPRRDSLREAATPPCNVESTDSDLYGLSPSGEMSRETIEEQEMSRRASLAQPQSALKAMGTPAMETSILALNKFKRRPRQPSVIRLMQEASELADVELGMDDFNPEDESTPLRLTSTRYAVVSSSSSRKRKRDVLDVPEPRSSPHAGPPNDPVLISSDLSSDLSSDDELSEESSLPKAPQGEPRPEDHEPLSDTMAPPLSSSPVPPSSHPSVNIAENALENDPHPRRGGHRAPDRSHVLTEMLTSLLPQPRTRRSNRLRSRQHELDLAESSSERPNESEISALEAPSSPPERVRRRVTRGMPAAPKVKKPKLAKVPSKVQARGRDRVPLAERSGAPNTLVQKRSTKRSVAQKAKRTYGGASAEDKENDPSFHAESSESIEESTVIEDKKRVKEQSLKKKFAEVDAWELEYETVDFGGISSPAWR